MKNKQGGFLKLIFLIVIGILILGYFDISIKEAIDWIAQLLKKVFGK